MKQADVVIGEVYLTYICGSLAPVIVVEKVEPMKWDRRSHTRFRIRREGSSTILSKPRTAAALRPKAKHREDPNPEGTRRRDASLATALACV